MKMKDNIETKIMEVTPLIAMRFLDKNTKNRPLKDAAIRKYAKLMREGKWQFNGEPIIIAKDGKLLDGQHRLKAMLACGQTLKMVIVTGVPNSAFKTVDIGHKRTGADALSTHNPQYKSVSMVLSASINIINQFGQTGIFDPQKRSSPPSHEELIDYVETHSKQLLRSIEFCGKLTGAKKFVPWSALSALYFLFSKKDVDAAELFFHKLSTGENLTSGDPVLLLRTRLINMRNAGGILRAREVIPYVLKAWELVREGKKIERLRIDDEYIPMVA